MKIFTKEQLQEIDRYTMEAEDISALELVRRVAEGVAFEIESRWRSNTRVIVFAGWGNNGADALATAEILADNSFHPEVFLFNIGGNRLTDTCRAAREMLLESYPSLKFTEVVSTFAMPEITSDCVVIDGLFGIGLNRELSGAFQMLARNINESNAFVVSIDIPSGLYSEWNENAVNRNIIHADLTLAVQVPHLAFMMAENDELVGEWKTINIDLSAEAMHRTPYDYYLIDRRDVKRMLPERARFASKADFGTALIAAGSYGMMGAAVLSAQGCLRAGVGRLTVYSPSCGYQVVQTAVPDATFLADPENTAITEIVLRHPYNAVAIGPGIGTDDNTIDALQNFLKIASANSRQVILDADALNCIAQRPNMLNYLPTLSVITPHAGEFDRLFGPHPSSEARIRRAIEKAAYYNIIIVLKGRYTAIVRPDGKVFFNSSGTPAMATPGSGDVLTGVIAAFVAQGFKPETASLIATYVHGVAGQIAADEHGSYGVTAHDIANNIGRAIKQIME